MERNPTKRQTDRSVQRAKLALSSGSEFASQGPPGDQSVGYMDGTDFVLYGRLDITPLDEFRLKKRG